MVWLLARASRLHGGDSSGSFDPLPLLVVLFAIPAALALIFYLAWLGLPPCRRCGKRGTMRWLREKKGGGPDRRFKENYQFCRACGLGRPETGP